MPAIEKVNRLAELLAKHDAAARIDARAARRSLVSYRRLLITRIAVARELAAGDPAYTHDLDRAGPVFHELVGAIDQFDAVICRQGFHLSNRLSEFYDANGDLCARADSMWRLVCLALDRDVEE